MRLFAGLLALALLGGGCAPAQAKPPMWVVRDTDSEIVLFGSVHVLPPGLDWKPAQLDAALAEADDIWFELPVDPATENVTGNLAAARGVAAEGVSLYAQLSPEGAARLTRAAESLNLSAATLDRLEPWFAEVVLAGAQFRKAGATSSSGVERGVSAVVSPKAKRQAFETPEEQIAMFDTTPAAEQIAALEQTLIEIETKPNAFNDLVKDWMAADLKALETEALNPLRKASPGIYARLLTQRNARWTAAIDKRMAGSGKTVVVVGVGHMLGPDGLPAKLRALGYSVEGP